MWPATVFAGCTFRLWGGACRRRAAAAAPLCAALGAASGRMLRECAGFLPWCASASGA